MRAWIIVVGLLVWAGCQGSSDGGSSAPAGPTCTPEAVHDGRALYENVFRAKALTQEPRGKPIVPKKVVGAKLYLTPPKADSTAYLTYAARCYAQSNAAPPSSGLDPLRVGTPASKIRVAEAGSSLVLSIEGNSSVGLEILSQSEALATRNASMASP